MATDISDDGNVVVGVCGPYAFRWTPTSGMQNIGLLPGMVTGDARAVSGDGFAVTGSMGDGVNRYIYRWTSTGGLQNLGALPGSGFSSGNGINQDGSVIVGLSATVTGYHAVLWSASTGMIDLNTHLADKGIDLTGWVLTDTGGVSADGSVIAGTGEHNGQVEAWVARFPGCAGDLDTSGSIDGRDIPFFVTCLLSGSATGDCSCADLDVNSVVDATDLNLFIQSLLAS